jgi:NAD(P)-dependent dehydrogenase (short-subunit alcohol dehydrogenase family)
MPEREAGTAGSRTPAGMPALAGMRIVVTGAAQGIGASTLRAYVAAGADVAVFDVNVKGTVYTNQSAFGLMRAVGGTIINFTSGAALKPYPRGAHYSAAKAAVAAWTRTVAHEWGRYGIRVNSVAPAMRTPMYEAHLARLSATELEALRARHRQRVALGGQLGDPDTDLAPVMVFLAGPGSRFITGQIIAVNGGLEEVR